MISNFEHSEIYLLRHLEIFWDTDSSTVFKLDRSDNGISYNYHFEETQLMICGGGCLCNRKCKKKNPYGLYI